MKRTPWYFRELPLECVVVAGAIGVGVVAAVATYQDVAADRRPGWMVWVQFTLAALLFAAGALRIARARHKDGENARLQSPQDLAAFAFVLHALLRWRLRIRTFDGSVRVTIHRVVRAAAAAEPTSLEQVINYVGGDGGLAGRVFSAKCGIIGRVARTGKAQVAKRKHSTPDEVIEEFISEWGYSREDAKKLTEDREAWMAVPLFGETSQQVVGIVYLDSRLATAFDDRAVQKTVIVASQGVAQFIRRRYT